MRAIALTLFPEMFPGPLGLSLAGKALEKGIWSLETLDIRSFAVDKHKIVDDSPYGGGVGMVMKPDVVDAAIEAAKKLFPSPLEGEGGAKRRERGALNEGSLSKIPPLPSPLPQGERGSPIIIYTSPRGVPFTQSLAHQLKDLDVIILCGRFEGVDQRVIEHHGMLEVSLGDFVLSGGEIAALAMLDACVRLLPGVIGKEEAIKNDSFSICATEGAPALSRASCDFQQKITEATKNSAGLLEYPHYTRPSVWKDKAVPDVLLSGNHEEIKSWRLAQAKAITAARRPDLNKKE